MSAKDGVFARALAFKREYRRLEIRLVRLGYLLIGIYIVLLSIWPRALPVVLQQSPYLASWTPRMRLQTWGLGKLMVNFGVGLLIIAVVRREARREGLAAKQVQFLRDALLEDGGVSCILFYGKLVGKRFIELPKDLQVAIADRLCKEILTWDCSRCKLFHTTANSDWEPLVYFANALRNDLMFDEQTAELYVEAGFHYLECIGKADLVIRILQKGSGRYRERQLMPFIERCIEQRSSRMGAKPNT